MINKKFVDKSPLMGVLAFFCMVHPATGQGFFEGSCIYRVTGVVRSNAIVSVGGYPCKGITIETSKVSRQYYYSTALKTNPDDDQYDKWRS